MKKAFFILFISLFASFVAKAQDDETTMVVRMMETDAEDLKCEIYPLPYDWRESEEFKTKIQELMNDGRYIQSVSPTKFGIVVVHKLNTNSINQIMDYFFDEKVKKLFKQGYSFKFSSRQFHPEVGGPLSIDIFEKNPKVTIQKKVKWDYTNEKKANKILSKMNAKGLYVKLSKYFDEAIVQNGHDDIVEQCYEYVDSYKEEDLMEIIEKKENEGWILGSVLKDYKVNEYNWIFRRYCVIFDKPRDGNLKRECIATINTQESLVDFLQQRVAPGYNIDMTWGGWNGKTKEMLRAESTQRLASSNNDMNIIDVLSGLVGKVTEIVDYSKGNTTGTGFNTGGNVDSPSSSSGSSGGRKCHSCNGSGKCYSDSPSADKYFCHGSKTCKYCNGKGTLQKLGQTIVCSSCKGDGKCKWCKGTGLCRNCKGKGTR